MITEPNVKINLGLHVLRKRPDGFHDLETLFVPYFGIRDRLEIITGDDWSRTLASLKERYGAGREGGVAQAGSVAREEGLSGSAVQEGTAGLAGFAVQEGAAPRAEGLAGSAVREGTAPRAESLVQAVSADGKLMITIARAEGVDWDPLQDLTARAYFLLAAHYELPPMKIFLEKRSPVGAGLGGGSADAAFALRMIAQLGELDMDDAALAAYAARLGSDCAFFVYNRPMLGTGRGEMLEPYELPLEGYRLEVFIPEGVAVSTADAYRGIVPHTPEIPLREVLRQDISTWREALRNDFETTVFAKYPTLAPVKEQLYARGAIYAAMSGSGSAFFGIYPAR